MLDKQKTLVIFLRIAGSVEILAFIAVFMPRSWMEAGHSWLGLGIFPDGPLIDFLIRQSSYVYGMHGVIFWILSYDLKRFYPLILLNGISFTLGGPIFFWIDYSAGIPIFITLLDSGSVFITGIILLWLSHSMKS